MVGKKQALWSKEKVAEVVAYHLDQAIRAHYNGEVDLRFHEVRHILYDLLFRYKDISEGKEIDEDRPPRERPR